MKRTLLILAIAYLVLLILVWALMWTGMNSHWTITLLLFSPRWVLALPLLVLVPLTLGYRKKLALIYLVHGWILLFPILDFHVGGLPFSKSASVPPNTPVLRVLTSNLGGGDIDFDRLIQLIEDEQIDVVLFQECKHRLAETVFKKLDWNTRQEDEIAIASPMQLSDAVLLARKPESHANSAAAVTCTIRLPDEHWPHDTLESHDRGNVRIRLVSAHFPTFRPALEKLQRFDFGNGPIALDQMGEAYREVVGQVHRSIAESEESVIVAGDFNMPVESDHFQRFWGSYQNAFSSVGSGFGHTKFTRFHGIRIDHLLADQHWQILTCEVGPNLGGDHRPVIATFSLRTE
ncbi:Endonuclease/Exonuclease/phosphatase family protein [Novipirellula aureliae]|uniref:Endonuclease/Exonuclease/phosphatase family protein n=1 Tax=Novipirellula aureliae TaxID=2527966 RepID=A0A5C6E635_9BACT|nr:endonuclease/exonuclease/phosphatase family protein [Novipirellula aureliae]TWU43417.1 Endonuclease/Exonuclease/phosphatase family protein [Novipirellula aureliae]